LSSAKEETPAVDLVVLVEDGEGLPAKALYQVYKGLKIHGLNSEPPLKTGNIL